MLPPRNRLRNHHDFSRTVRGGRRSGRRRLVVHLARRPTPDPAAAQPGVLGRSEPRVGLVVSSAVGGAVTRKAVSRRLRHVAGTLLGVMPADADLVIRALPAAVGSTSAELTADLDGALRSVLRTGASR